MLFVFQNLRSVPVDKLNARCVSEPAFSAGGGQCERAGSVPPRLGAALTSGDHRHPDRPPPSQSVAVFLNLS